ncbi:TPA: hypothetical protein N0F65_005003 [Lagenidium giganteum]|uniref:Peptidase C1A papain C-terminal domain-containing protein n=1 Tax=Lagenidium giganteum TaxID=4803 RepID=A0AAV2ZDY7_9STRA|nr:TPA: hypothetical protein N0F65_005003 [Lagenidium giganteum]
MDTNVLHPRFHSRFLQERAQVEEDLREWERSPYAVAAQDFHGQSEATWTLDDKLLRFFATKMAAEEMSALNPHATFSTATPFALLTDEEFADVLTRSFSNGADAIAELPSAAAAPRADVLADTVDWSTTSQCIAPVKSQGRCGNCWAFGTTAGAESFYCLKKNNGSLVVMSEQDLTSCDPTNQGCNGGWGEYALRFISKRGICTQAEYPYTSGVTQESGECLRQQNHCTPVQTGISGSVRLDNNDNAMMSWLGVQPVSVALAGGNPAWRTYRSGVITSCPSNRIDHVVLVVGYGSLDGVDHYKIKNSWGSWWGMNGYVYLKRGSPSLPAGSDGTCEMLSSPFTPY